jgi:hypothetical protein
MRLLAPRLDVRCWLCNNIITSNIQLMHKQVACEPGWEGGFAMTHIAVCGNCTTRAGYKAYQRCNGYFSSSDDPWCSGSGVLRMASRRKKLVAVHAFDQWLIRPTGN